MKKHFIWLCYFENCVNNYKFDSIEAYLGINFVPQLWDFSINIFATLFSKVKSFGIGINLTLVYLKTRSIIYNILLKIILLRKGNVIKVFIVISL